MSELLFRRAALPTLDTLLAAPALGLVGGIMIQAQASASWPTMLAWGVGVAIVFFSIAFVALMMGDADFLSELRRDGDTLLGRSASPFGQGQPVIIPLAEVHRWSVQEYTRRSGRIHVIQLTIVTAARDYHLYVGNAEVLDLEKLASIAPEAAHTIATMRATRGGLERRLA
jgi:hypothetical protein